MGTRAFRRPSAALLLVAFAAAGCGGVTAFQGQTPTTVTGTPPAPPPTAEEPPPPPAPPPRVEVRENKIAIGEKIQFEFNKAVIKPESFGLIDEIAGVIQANPHLKKIAIEGHASNEGEDSHNLKLSDDRAKAVMFYLIGKGIQKERLTAKGYGETKPVADNNTPEGREKNRRVEFNIVEQEVTKKTVEVDHTGQEKIVGEQKSLVANPSAEVPAPPEAAKPPAKALAPTKAPAPKAPPKGAAPAPKPAAKATPKPAPKPTKEGKK